MFIDKAVRFIRCKVVTVYYNIIYGKKFEHGKLRLMSNFKLMIGDQGKVQIGDCYFNNNCSINAMESIIIGSHCLFGENVKIYDHNHKFRDKTKLISSQGYSTAAIIIGQNCWIGSNVTILKGVHIGNNVIIGADCLIYNDIPSDTIVKLKRDLIIEQNLY